MCKVSNCKWESTGEDGFCEGHRKQYYYARWHPSRGWEAIKDFAFECFPELCNPKYGMADYHVEMYKALWWGLTQSTDNLDNLHAFFTHRYSAKTTVGAVISSVWAIDYDLRKFIVYRGDSLKKASINFLARVRTALTTQRNRYIFGDIIPTARETGLKDTETMLVVKNTAKTMVMAMGLEQSSRSLISWATRPDLMFWDDCESDDNTKTEESQEKIKVKVFSEDINAMDRTGMGIMFQTPIKKEGLYDIVMENPNFKKVIAPCYKKENGEYVLDENGEKISNWPGFWPIERLEKKRQLTINDPKLGKKSWYREWLLEMVADTATSIDPKWIQHCTYDRKYESGCNWIKFTTINGDPVQNPKWEIMAVTAAIDPATSMKGSACDSVCVYVGTLSDYRYVVLQYFAGKYRSRDVVKSERGLGLYDIEMKYENIEHQGIVGEYFRRSVYWKPDVCVVEAVGEYENTYREILLSYERWWILRQKHEIRFIMYKPTGSDEKKTDRIISTLNPPYETRRVYHTDGMKELESQITNLIESKKDIADALHMAIKHAEAPDNITDVEMRDSKETEQPIKIDYTVMAHRSMIGAKGVRT